MQAVYSSAQEKEMTNITAILAILATLESGGNFGAYGDKVNLGRACSEETKKKVSERHKRQTPWNKGKKGLQIHSEETRKKIKENHARYWLGKKGLPRSEEWKQKIGSANRKSQLGRKHTEETRQKIFNHPNSQRGKSHWNWKGGITDYERRLYFNRRRRVKKLGNGGAHSQGEWKLSKLNIIGLVHVVNEQNPKSN